RDTRRGPVGLRRSTSSGRCRGPVPIARSRLPPSTSEIDRADGAAPPALAQAADPARSIAPREFLFGQVRGEDGPEAPVHPQAQERDEERRACATIARVALRPEVVDHEERGPLGTDAVRL